jgi:hypothetical protein
MSSRIPPARQTEASLLGLAFNADDGVRRITRGKNFFLLGGSQETHGRMQETVIKLNEELTRRGQALAEVSLPELREIVEDILR